MRMIMSIAYVQSMRMLKDGNKNACFTHVYMHWKLVLLILQRGRAFFVHIDRPTHSFGAFWENVISSVRCRSPLP